MSHTFRLRNDGREAITIITSDSSCTCTTSAKLKNTSIEPGQSVALPVTLKSGSGDGPEAGRFTYYYRSKSRTDAPVHYAVGQVTTDVIPDYRVAPTLIDFGTVDHLDPVVRTIWLRPEALADVSIISAASASETLTAKSSRPAIGEHDIPVEVTFSGRSLWKSGPIEASVMLETSSPGNPTTQILARAQFIAPVEVHPDSIVIGSGVAGTVDREIEIKSSRTARIANLRSSDIAVRLASIGPSEGRTLRVRATFLGDDNHRAINALLSIDLASSPATSTTDVRTITIPAHRLAP